MDQPATIGALPVAVGRGVLEVQTALLPGLEVELRDHTGLTLSEFDVPYQIWGMPDKCR